MWGFIVVLVIFGLLLMEAVDVYNQKHRETDQVNEDSKENENEVE